MPEQPTTCVIGAGVSGLTAVKALGDWRIPHTCFEASDDVGGNWYFQNPNGRSSAYRSLHIDTSKHAISFSDFPMDGRYPDFPHHSEIKQFLQEYAERFGLRERIRFNTAVERAERLPGGGWRIATADGEEHSFDALLVCNGHHWDPSYPDFPGELRRARRCTRTSTSIRATRSTWPASACWSWGSATAPSTSPPSWRARGSPRRCSSRPAAAPGSCRSTCSVGPRTRCSRPTRGCRSGSSDGSAQLLPRLVSGRMEDFGLPTPDHKFLEAHPTVSSELLLRLGSGDAIAKPNVAVARAGQRPLHRRQRRAGRRDRLRDRLQISFPFFDPGFISAPGNVLPLYKRMFKPGIDDLGFIGFGQAIPTIFPFAECQSKLAGRWLAGTGRRPAPVEMEQEIRRDERRFTGHYNQRPRHTMQLDYYVYDYDLRQRVIPAGQERARTLRRGRSRAGPRSPTRRPSAAITSWSH